MSETHSARYLDWTAPGGAVTIRLSRAVIPRMNVEIMRGFGVTRRRGTESGGVLIGGVAGGANAVITVDDFETVPCDYAFGPSYLLGPADEERFREAVRRHGDAAVGFFRSHTREGLAFDGADAELVGRFFERGIRAALVVKPFATRTSVGAWSVSSNGRLAALSGRSEFPFAAGTDPEPAPAHPETPPPRPEPPPVRVAAPPAVPHEAAPLPAPPLPAPPLPAAAPASAAGRDRTLMDILGVRQESTPASHRTVEDNPLRNLPVPRASGSPVWRQRLAMAAFTVATLALGGVAGYQYGVNSNSPLRDPLNVGMFVRRSEGETMTLHWNQFSYPARIASRATLTVQEQNGSDIISLSQAELRNGQMLLRLRSDRAALRLDLTLPDNRTVSNSLDVQR